LAEPVVISSAITKVSVFRAGAVVTRSAELPGGNADEIALDGLPLALEDDSVRVRIEGEGPLPRPTDVRVTLVVPPLGESLTPPSQAELLAARDAVQRLSEMSGRINHELELLGSVQLQLPPVFQNRPPRPTPAAAWLGALEWTEKAKAARVEERARLQEQLRRAEEALARLQRREAELASLRGASAEKVRKRVVIRLRDGEARGTLRLEYRVPGATWRPTYALRMARDGQSALLSVRALVVQDSGEPWERVALSLSTADLLARAEIPELKSLRIGRKQPEPPRRAWREPPAGLDALFESIDRALAMAPDPRRREPVRKNRPSAGSGPSLGARFDRNLAAPAKKLASSAMPLPGAARGAMPMAPPPAARAQAATPAVPMPAAPSASLASPARRSAPKDMAKRSRVASNPMADQAMDLLPPEAEEDLDGYGGGAEMEAGASNAPAHGMPNALRYGDLVMASWRETAHPRGKLRSLTLADRLGELPGGSPSTLESLISDAAMRAGAARYADFPAQTEAVEQSAGVYDHRYDAEGPVDVPADGKLHSVPLFGRRAEVGTTLIVVPRESTQAVRMASLKNPLEAPLLAGPAEIYLEDEFLVVSPLRTVPAGAQLQVGLGIEEALKVARNVHFDEEKAGLLGGSATLRHEVQIELASRLGAPVKVEVRERVPIKDDETTKDLELLAPTANPPWEAFDQAETSRIQGGKRWRFALGPNETKKLTYSYTVKIDAKSELVGGNRRE